MLWSGESQAILTMNHRFVTDGDLDLLATWNHQLIHDEGHRNPMSIPKLEERMRGWLEGEYRAVVFEIGSEPVAYALYRETAHEVYLRQFFVSGSHRRRGVGKRAIEILRGQVWPPDKRLTVDVLTANAPAIAFWRAVGYTDYSLTLEIMPPDAPAQAVAAQREQANRTPTTISGPPREEKRELMKPSYHMHLSQREITDPAVLDEILRQGRWTTLALVGGETPDDPWPYALTLSYGYAAEERALYFHTAREGLKLEILAANPRVCGTVVDDRGYLQGQCAHAYRSVVYWGEMEIVDALADKRRAMEILLEHLEDDPAIMRQRLLDRGETYARACILRLRIDGLTGKQGQ
jgi:nitroimidazol reductase NimA-like FMN-containing flavoprotein (pyridoxamine 5'-phosphate oxidase superfamily)/predicted acetyltransferase